MDYAYCDLDTDVAEVSKLYIEHCKYHGFMILEHVLTSVVDRMDEDGELLFTELVSQPCFRVLHCINGGRIPYQKNLAFASFKGALHAIDQMYEKGMCDFLDRDSPNRKNKTEGQWFEENQEAIIDQFIKMGEKWIPRWWLT